MIRYTPPRPTTGPSDPPSPSANPKEAGVSGILAPAMTVTLLGPPRLLVEDAALFRLGIEWARRLQVGTPSPPWDAIVIGLHTTLRDFVILSFAQGHIALAVPLPLEEVRDKEEEFFTHLPAFLEVLDGKYRESYDEFARDGNLMDGQER